MVTIEVGAEKEHFVVHQSFLCAKSPYFAKALSGSFQEGITRFIRLPDTSSILFRIFVAWLYHGSLGYGPRAGRAIDEDFKSLDVTEEDLQQEETHQKESQYKTEDDTESIDSEDPRSNEVVTGHSSSTVVASTSAQSSTAKPTDKTSPASKSKYQGDDPNGWPCGVLIKLYVLADCFDIRELRADSLDSLIRSADEDPSVCRSINVRYIFLNTPPGCKLRTYVVHRAAHRLTFGEDISVWLAYPVEFLAAVMIKNSRRLPNKQCKECYKGALENKTMVASEAGDRNSEEDLPPYKTDLCFYHEHPDDEERKACRLHREGSKTTA
jgi:hypothetical protein